MTEDKFLNECYAVWSSSKLEGDANDVKSHLKALIDPAIARATIASDGRFTFATDIQSKTFTDTNNLVTVYGNNDDCRDVYAVLWGTGENVLRPYTEYERDISFSGTSPTGVVGWVRRPTPDGDAPIIEIIGTVAVGDTCKFRYVRKNLTINDWPDPWGYVLISQVLAMANNRFGFNAKNDLSQMIDFYKSPQRGSTQALPDPTTRAYNVAASQKYIG